jgi:NAD(P)-dependent dehydrogenase (short-subunit alcohol dehydrogenase family)
MREGARLMGRLEGKVALVSGSAQGIGRAVAELFAEEGAFVYAGDIKDVASGKGIESIRLDLTKPDDWKKAVDAIVAKHGRIDVLVNNAGIVRAYGQVADTELEDFNAVVSVNLTGTFLGMKAVLPAMRKFAKGRSSTSLQFGAMLAWAARPRTAPERAGSAISQRTRRSAMRPKTSG